MNKRMATTMGRVGVLALVVALLGCSKESKLANETNGKADIKATPVRVESVKKSPLELTLALTGTVEAGRIAQLASPAEGPVLSLKVREGDLVNGGQVLLMIGRTEGASALVSSLREDMKKEQDNLARTRHLVDSGALAGEQLDIASANVSRMRAQMVKAAEMTGDYAVHAPWSGVVSKMKVRDGDFVGPRAPLAEIFDPKSLMVRVAVPEQAAAHLAKDMKLAVELDAYPENRFIGHISRLYPYLDPRSRTRMAEVTLADSPYLLPGMFARVFLVQSTIPDAVTVPAHSLVAVPDGGSAVFVMKDGEAVRNTVTLGVEANGRVQVRSGLKPGEMLIVSGQEALKERAPVRAVAPAETRKVDEASKPAVGSERPAPEKSGAADRKP